MRIFDSTPILADALEDAVTTLASGVDGAVRRIETAYDSQGNPYLVTSFDAATGGSIVNQIQRAFNGLGQMIAEYQSHSGAVNTSTTPKVQYAYSEMASGANHSRLVSITYPSGYVLTFNYSSGLNGSISRLSSLSDSTGTLEGYKYLGLGTVVERNHPQATLTQTYIGATGVLDDPGDNVKGLDRFGRVQSAFWYTLAPGVPSTAVTVSEFRYSYDADSNVTMKNNIVNSSFSENYSYDGLNQLVNFSGGISNTKAYDYDALGNFNSVTTNAGTPVTRTANHQNEITSIGGATTPAYDANGNMTGDETGKTFVYDAWNRMVAVKSGSTTLEAFSYGGENRRVTNTVGSTTTDLYYSAAWQVLEEKVGSITTNRYVWSPVYVDAMILRDRDTDANGSLNERFWVQQDANWNVTAIVDGSGVVQERYAYDAYGSVTIYSSAYSVRGSSSYAQTYLFQGRPIDAVTGNYDNRMRWSSPTLGRWTSMDPSEYTSRETNLYLLLGNNPIVYLDASGLAKYKLGFTNVKGFAPKLGDCGEFEWQIKWNLDKKTPKKVGFGKIVQEIEVEYDIKDKTGNAVKLKNNLHYWESWEISDDEKTTSALEAFDDKIYVKGSNKGTKGWYKVTATAYFFDKMTNKDLENFNFKQGAVTEAGKLPATLTDPKIMWPQADTSDKLVRVIKVSWDCCSGDAATKLEELSPKK